MLAEVVLLLTRWDLQLAESVTQMSELIEFSKENRLGPRGEYSRRLVLWTISEEHVQMPCSGSLRSLKITTDD